MLEILRAKHKGGGLSNFEMSIATQLATNKTLSRKQVDAILQAKSKEDARRSWPGPDQVPAGYYAIDVPDYGWTLIKVWRGERDPSYVHCYLLSGETDERGTEIEAGSTLARIVAVGAFKAAKDYGGRTGKCSQCRKRLTNALSRKLRIGPVCLARFIPDVDEKNFAKLEATLWLEAHGIDPYKNMPLDIDLEALEAAEVTA